MGGSNFAIFLLFYRRHIGVRKRKKGVRTNCFDKFIILSLSQVTVLL
jgi:hypothetical protein